MFYSQDFKLLFKRTTKIDFFQISNRPASLMTRISIAENISLRYKMYRIKGTNLNLSFRRMKSIVIPYLYVPGRLMHFSKDLKSHLYWPVLHSSMSLHCLIAKEYSYPDWHEGNLVRHSKLPFLFTQYWCNSNRQLCRFSVHSSISTQLSLKTRLKPMLQGGITSQK